MALPDISTLTIDEIAQLQQSLAARLQQLQLQDQATEESLRAGLGQAVAQLVAVIGPDAPTVPTTKTLTEVQLFTDAQMAANAGLGLRLSFQATELIARKLADVARLASGILDA